jgi:D-alanyl-lipoteichoic acid acyltransferase DltB (MBOAT superfamily)
MTITSAYFHLFIGFTLIVYLLRCGSGYRQTILLIASGIFIASQSTSVMQLVPLAALIGCGYGVLWASNRGLSPVIFATVLGTYVFAFVYVKQYSMVAFLGAPLAGPYVTLGISYILFRVLHLAIDSRAGLIRGRVKPLMYLLYVGSVFTFVSGPIQRYEDFEQQAARVDAHALTNEIVFTAFSRIVNGLLVTLLIAQPLLYLHGGYAKLAMRNAGGMTTLAAYWAAAALYTLYMYSSFAAYMNIVVGLGLLFGFELPENFNRPFESVSFLEFWSRWHITLSKWFRFYVFNPIQLALARRWSNPRSAPYLGAIAFFVTFSLMGLWHGSTASFLIYGLLLGGGTSVNRLYQVLMQRALGTKPYGVLKRRTIHILVSRGLTISFFAMALTCLWLNANEIVNLVRGHGLINWLGAWIAVSAITGAMLSAMIRVEKGLRRVLAPFNIVRGSGVYKQAVLSAKVAVLIALNVVVNERAMEFVYQVF